MELPYTMADFNLLQEVYRSSSGAVFQARHKSTNTIYALKERKCGEMGMQADILHEVRILSSVRHTNIVECMGYFFEKSSGLLYIVLEWADGGDLYTHIQTRLTEKRPWKELEIWSMFIQILRGLVCLSAKRIVHRDLKPLNILVCKNHKKKSTTSSHHHPESLTLK